ncbi:MAG: GIY-YIG nuclease family protein, partial [Calditrichaeota bacterium]|nr:GIY-YIG nuclease family protein [Calditrichota bacterium]
MAPRTRRREPDGEGIGYVYVVTNPAMPGLVKIGWTDSNPPEDRIRELYAGVTGVPVPFEIVYMGKVRNAREVEKALHNAFGPNRYNPKREFFAIEPDQAIVILRLLQVEDLTSDSQSQAD